MSVDGLKDLTARLSGFDRLGLARLPTPLQLLGNLSKDLGGPGLWAKREDATGLGFGGNKLRKLDFVLQQAIDTGCDTIVSGGVVQSNSQRQVAAAAAKLGLECHLIVYQDRLAPPSDEYLKTGNVLLNHLFGAYLHPSPWTGDRNSEITNLCAELDSKGKKTFMVPYGVSSALGAVGYATAAAEIAEQSMEAGFGPSAIVHSSGSAGTQAGLILGTSLCLPGTQVIGIDIDAEPERVRRDVIKFGHDGARLLGIEFDESRVEVVAGHAGPAYGIPHPATIDAIKLAGRREALLLDPVYSGKGMAGLIGLIKTGRWSPDEHIVFINTGGEPALFAYRQSFEFR